MPDGDWFGFLEGVTTAATNRLTFDLTCHFDGGQAEPAAIQDGHPVPLEFTPYIRNQNPKVFDIPVSGVAVVEDYLLGTLAFPDWIAALSPDNGCSAGTGYAACPLWVRITGGEAVLLYGILPEWAGDGRGS